MVRPRLRALLSGLSTMVMPRPWEDLPEGADADAATELPTDMGTNPLSEHDIKL